MELQRISTDNLTTLTAFAESRIGGRGENQDSYGWKETRLGYLVTVCDGMGGGPGGKTASTIAVSTIISSIAESNGEEEPSNIVKKAVAKANLAIIEAGNDNPRLKGMGSTATVLLISEKSALIAHVGDSRVYQIRDGKKVFRTFDHSMVFEMVAQGIITEEQARLSAQSNIITRALGIKPEIEVEINEVPYLKGDRFMLCTDGIHGSVPEPELIKKVSSKKSKLGAITDDIATTIDNIGHSSGGGHDNLTLAIVETNINSKLKPKMSKQLQIILGALGLALIISLTLNVMQYTGHTPASKGLPTDSTKVLRDSLNISNSKIDSLMNKMGQIKEHANKIKGASDQAAKDSILKIINNPK